MDEYGRHPGNPEYEDKELSPREWETHLTAQREWARKRVGRSLARVDDRMGEDTVADRILEKYLRSEGL